MKPNDYQMIQQLRAQVDELLLLADPTAEREAPHGTTEGIARPAWVMCFGTDEVDDVRGLTRRWVQLYTHEGPKVVDYVLTCPTQTDLEMWDKAADLLGFTLVPGIPEVASREDARPAV